MPQLTPLTAGSSVTHNTYPWQTTQGEKKKKAKSGPVSTALLGKRDEDYAGWREAHGRRKHPPPALEEKAQTGRSG